MKARAACAGEAGRSSGEALRVRLAKLGLVAALLVLGAWSPPTVQLNYGDRYGYDAAGVLFASAYREILEYYLKPVSLETLSIAGMSGLDAPDRSFDVAEQDRRVVFLDQGKVFTRIVEPRADDAQGWAAITSAAILAGRSHSAELAQATDEELYRRIFDAMLPRLDPFSRYAGRDEAREQRAARDGFGGIGVSLDYTEATPRISSLVAGGPSERAGIRVDDRLLAIDGVAITSLSQRQVVRRLRGPSGSRVLLTLMRPGRDRTLDLLVTRALIVQPTVSEETEHGIAVFQVDGFNVRTASELIQALGDARRRLGPRLKGMVLDLRNNPGGLLDQAAAVASVFLDRGEIVSTRGRNPSATQNFEASARDRSHGLPMAVLVNGGSASASEIVAAALQDDGRAVVVGSASYGKGTVQMVLRLENDGELTLTWARLYPPSGYLLHHHGVIPTFCTSRPVDPLAPPEDDATEVEQVLARGLSPLPDQRQPRAALTDAEWTALRASCPAETRDQQLDLDVAERVLLDPALYARALALSAESIARAGHAALPALQ